MRVGGEAVLAGEGTLYVCKAEGIMQSANSIRLSQHVMVAAVAALSALVALALALAAGQAAAPRRPGASKLMNPAALTEQGAGALQGELRHQQGRRSSSRCTATGRRSAPIASTTS